MSLRQVNGGLWKDCGLMNLRDGTLFFSAALRGANPAVNNPPPRAFSATISAAREREDENDAKANLPGIEA
jgi:hypothetical protein